ncbi:hypothetical protein QAD02_008929 [Eretmocerus hayati]|uniref:Uncharacterized protein n=1 Tax=Eretmocerus hayati TaxID=131215 RepID=A0ACC2N883_9HYME|nr:hypothetical protein QAD02_008929 [Eretmocerus hayati]
MEIAQPRAQQPPEQPAPVIEAGAAEQEIMAAEMGPRLPAANVPSATASSDAATLGNQQAAAQGNDDPVPPDLCARGSRSCGPRRDTNCNLRHRPKEASAVASDS